MVAWAAAVLVVTLLTGCAAGIGMAESEAPVPVGRALALGAVAPAAVMADVATELESAESVAEPAPRVEAPQPKDESASVDRLRVFSAELEMSVPNVVDGRDEVIALADTFDGYVESSSEQAVTIRVPAERFDEARSAVEAIGRVLRRNVTAADVTDQFTDMESRLVIARTSRDRLLELLERSGDAEDQVRILREIRRLTEEIERLEASLRSLQDQIAFSRISVWFVSRIDQDATIRDAIPFPWIAALEPVYATVGAARRAIPVTLPDSFAVFSEGKTIDAASATGVRFRSGALVNDPAGDEAFWQEALLYNLEPLYRAAERVEAGRYRGVLLTSKDVQPFYYLVTVTVRNGELIVAEAFFPNETERDAFFPKIVEALQGAEQ